MAEQREQEPFHWRTAISYKTRDRIVVRGYDINELAGNVSFVEAIWLTWSGELPPPNHARMLEAVLVSMHEHAYSPSTVSSRFTVSGGNPIHAGLAAGILTMGNRHGVADVPAHTFLAAMKRVKEDGLTLEEAADEVCKYHRENRLTLVGFHHPQHIKDPRVERLIELAHGYGVAGEYLALAQAVEDATEKYWGRRLYINDPGIIAGICLDMGMDPDQAKGVSILSRAVGLIAHCWEEMHREGAWRASSGADIMQPLDLRLQLPEFYDGPADRTLPE